MRALMTALLLALVLPAHAQMYKCVDARGKIQYSDKPIPGCRTERAIAAPPRAATAAVPSPNATPRTSGRTKVAAKATNPEAVPESQLAARCKTLHDEQEWLNSAAGKKLDAHAERVAQVEQALAVCH